jgi:hypothetical protein
LPTLRAARELRILDFDIENRPLSYLGMDFTTSEITAIAASFEGEDTIHTFLLGDMTVVEMLDAFRELYDAADIVTGHYIRRHDLPILNGAMLEMERPPLGPTLASDTKTDLKIAKGVSKSQESLAAMYGLPAPKIHMTNPMWREANRLTPEGLALTRERVEGDIVQHKQLRARLLAAGVLRAPTLWKP